MRLATPLVALALAAGGAALVTTPSAAVSLSVASPDCCALHWVDEGSFPNKAGCEALGIHDVDYDGAAQFECNANPNGRYELWVGYPE